MRRPRQEAALPAVRVRSTLAVAAIFVVAPIATASAETLVVYAHSELDFMPKLLRFDGDDPGTTAEILLPRFALDPFPLALDVRPATGELFALAASCSLPPAPSCTASWSRIDAETGAVTPGAPEFLALPPFFLDGPSHFAVDFDSTLDELRIVHAAEWSARVRPASGFVTDLGSTTPAIPLAGLAERIDPGTGATEFLAVDPHGTALYRLGGPNGTPSPDGGALTQVAALDLPEGWVAGFDASPSGRVYLSLIPTPSRLGTVSPPLLFEVESATGSSTLLGTIGGVSAPYYLGGLAVLRAGSGVPVQAIPTLSSSSLAGFALALFASSVFVFFRRRSR